MNANNSPTLSAQKVTRYALVGSPNSGKTTLFNSLTGLKAKTGNYPGVTVSRYEGALSLPSPDGPRAVTLEDLPGTYSLDAISPDEQVVTDVLDPDNSTVPSPEALIVTLDTTTLNRSLQMLVHALQTGLPVLVVLTFADEMAKRGGHIDQDALGKAIGVPIMTIVAGDKRKRHELLDKLAQTDSWERPAVLPPTDPKQSRAWIKSVLKAASFTAPVDSPATRKIDAFLLHPVFGTLFFFLIMYLFFQIIFTAAAPIMDAIDALFGWLGEKAAAEISIPWLSSFVGDALIGGIGGVIIFLPQIILLFIMISALEGSGYMSRAAFLMDKIMSKAGLEGRAFVSLLSSLACAIPGIMSTRTLPSAKDRLATMMGAPLMTCSARLPVYVLLVGMLVPRDAYWGPLGAQGTVMFALYFFGAVLAMASAWFFSRFGTPGVGSMPFYMEMPPYRKPHLKSVLLSAWDSSKSFLQKVTTVILGTTVVLWALMNLPLQSETTMQNAGITETKVAAAFAAENDGQQPTDEELTAQIESAQGTYVLEHSYAASIGKVVQPIFAPLGFDWRINVGVMAAQAAREVFVATIGQIASASDPDDPQGALEKMVVSDGPHKGEKLFSPPTIAAILVFFMVALQCMATLGVMRRETGTWKWPLIAFTYMLVLAWVLAFAARTAVAAFM